MSLPTYYPAPYIVDLLLNTSKTTAPAPLSLTAPRVQVHSVTAGTIHQPGQARLSIYIGRAITDRPAESTDNGGNPLLENWKGTDSHATFISKLVGSHLRITVARQENGAQRTNGTEPENLPAAPVEPYLPNDVMIPVFFGKVIAVTKRAGVGHTLLDLECTDIFGIMREMDFIGLPKRVFSPSENDADWQMVPHALLPDFNQLQETISVGNKDNQAPAARGKVKDSLELLDGDVVIKTLAFTGVDEENPDAQGSKKAFWTDLDIVHTVFDYFNSFYGAVLQGANVETSVVDKTQNLTNKHGTYSSRSRLLDILNEMGTRRGFTGTLVYSMVGKKIKITLELSIQSRVAINGYLPMEEVNVTFDEGRMPLNYVGTPEIVYVDNGPSGNIKISTLPATFVYTFKLKDQFYKGYRTTSQPTNAQVIAGGNNQKFFSRFVLDPNKLVKVKGNEILDNDNTFMDENWTESSTPIGAKFNIDSINSNDYAASNVSLTTLNANDTTDPVSFEKTMEIGNVLPFSVNNDGSVGMNTPGQNFIFYSVDKDVIKPLTSSSLGYPSIAPTYNLNTINLNPEDRFIKWFDDTENTKDVYITCAVHNTPPLCFYYKKHGSLNQDLSFVNVVYPYAPLIVMRNSVIGIKSTGVPVIIDDTMGQGQSGNAVLWSNEGMTATGLLQEMIALGAFFAREKRKVTWTVNYIESRNFVGKWLKNMEILGIEESNGIEWEMHTIDSPITMQEWNWNDNTTTFYADYGNFSAATVTAMMQ